MRELKSALSLSVLVHAAVILLPALSLPQCGNGDGSQPQEGTGSSGPKNVDIQRKDQAKSEPVEVSLVPTPLKFKAKKSRAVHAKDKCAEYYGGLGITQSLGDDLQFFISEVVPGYPGASIGLEIGDVILDPPNDLIIGEVGTELTLKVKKFSTKTVETYTVVRGRICYKHKLNVKKGTE